MQKLLGDAELPPGYRVVFGGSTKDMAESAAYAGQALLLAMILIFLILASQFGSFLQPLAIMRRCRLAYRRVPRPAGRRHHLNILGSAYHAHGPGHQERHPAGRFHQPGAGARDGGTRGLARGGRGSVAPHPDDHARDGVGMLPLALGLGEGAGPAHPWRVP